MIALGSDRSPSPTITSGNMHLSCGHRLQNRITDLGDLVIAHVWEDRQREDFGCCRLADGHAPVRGAHVRIWLMTRNRVMDRALNALRCEVLLNPGALGRARVREGADVLPPGCAVD